MPAQGDAAWANAPERSRLRMRTLATLRWAIILVEAAGLSAAHLLTSAQAPYSLCFALVGASAWVNMLTSISSPGQRLTGVWEATGQFAFDILQIVGLLFLTGGLANPFALLILAPVVVAAANLPLASVLSLGALSAASIAGLLVLRPPSGLHALAAAAPGTQAMAAAALVTGMGLIAAYVRQAAVESARMALALDVTQTVLSREQQMSALGALAAAAAHELGTPLATISIVAKEMARGASDPALQEDAELLISQAARCREILQRLTHAPASASDALHERMTLLQLVHEVLEARGDTKGVRVEAVVTGAAGAPAPDIWRRPEILHALAAFVENAVDFAQAEVLVTARFDARSVALEVRDDGPGFSSEVLAKLGEPYVTTRPGAEGSRTGHIGMGLGFFIAKTLLERTGAVVAFQNARPRGAIVSARWRRESIEVDLNWSV